MDDKTYIHLFPYNGGEGHIVVTAVVECWKELVSEFLKFSFQMNYEDFIQTYCDIFWAHYSDSCIQ